MISHKYNIGIEREGLRTNEQGDLSDLPHSNVFGNRNTNAFITTDFGAAQLELRTNPCSTTKECYEKLRNITNVVLEELRKNKELLWPYSMPCKLPEKEKFNFGEYGENQKEKDYETYLSDKYGYEMYCMSGVHLNLSLTEEYYEVLKEKYSYLPDTLEDAYFKIIRNYLKKVWILIGLFGATPKQLGDEYQNNCSIRNSNKQGFKNINLEKISYENKKKHIESIRKNIEKGNIKQLSELYTPIRIKGTNKYDINDLEKNPINHLEVRVLDLNPFDITAISLEEMEFITAFLFNCLIEKEDKTTFDYREVAEKGLNEKQIKLINLEINKLIKIDKELTLDFHDSIKKIQKEFIKGNTLSNKINRLIEEKGYINALVDIAKSYTEEAKKLKYSVIDKDKTIYDAPAALIRDAILRGVDYNVIDYRENNSIMEFSNHGIKEYIVGATQTKKDNYVVPFLTNDKFEAKEILQKVNLKVPKGIMISNKLNSIQIEDLYENYIDKPIVIKPRTTNAGVGITVFQTPPTKQQFQKAVEFAFNYDSDVLIEHFAKGEEYRFLIVNGKCISVVTRRCAQVIGNGHDTIKQLIDKKNQEEWHVLLDTQIKIDSPLKTFISKNNLTLDTIPKKDEIVKLRKNSNCSTGGESISLTDKIPDYFKRIAEKAAKAFNSYVCGVDIIIDDMNKKDYTILETNSDPGYDINEWPYEGKEAHVGQEILKMLGLINESDEIYEK